MAEAVKSMQEIDALTTAKPVPVGAVDAFTSQLPEAVPGSEYTGGVPLIEDKAKLVGIPFIVQEWRGHESDKGPGEYVNVKIMLPNGVVVCFNDGGSAIGKALEEHLDRTGRMEGLYCARGLRESNYETEIDGRTIAATTFWLT